MISTLAVVILILMLAGSVPAWPYSKDWGYGPSSVVGILLVILVIMALMGRF